jgi:hypothetical protein
VVHHRVVDPALAPLIGAALGGFLAGGSGLALERFRVKRDREAAVWKTRLDARRAARLIAEELRESDRRVRKALDRSVYTWEPSDDLLATATWSEYRADFAASANPDAWAAVADAYAEVSRLNEHLVAVLEEEHLMGIPPDHPLHARELDPNAKKYADGAASRMDIALSLLDDLMTAEI